MSLELLVDNAQARDGLVFGVRKDPIEFFRETLAAVGVKVYFEYWPHDVTGNDGFLVMTSKPKRISGDTSDLTVALQYLPNDQGVRYSDELLPKELKEFFSRYGRDWTGKLLRFRLPNLSIFGEHSAQVNLVFSLIYNGREDMFNIRIDQPSPGLFSLGTCEVPSEFARIGVFNDLFGAMDGEADFDFSTIKKFDYRPFMHRAIELRYLIKTRAFTDPRTYREMFRAAELYSITTKKHQGFHDPRTYYSDGLFDSSSTVVSDFGIKYASMLFGPESEALLAQVKSRMATHSGWVSVPRLNLGIKQLPNPDSNLDGYVASGAPFMIELLSGLGIMPPEQASRVVKQRLTNYLMQKTPFQKSPSEARRVLALLHA